MTARQAEQKALGRPFPRQRIAKQVVDEAALARHQTDQRLHGGLEHGDGRGVGAFGCHGLELVIEGGVPELHQLVDKGVAVAEVVDEGAEVHLGRRRQLAHREAAQPLLGGDGEAGIEQFLTGGVHLAGAPGVCILYAIIRPHKKCGSGRQDLFARNVIRPALRGRDPRPAGGRIHHLCPSHRHVGVTGW